MPLFTSRMENLGEEKESVHAFKGAPALLDYSIKDYERNMKFSEEEVVYPIRMDGYRGPYTFRCDSANGYIHLAATRLSGRCTILQANGDPLAPAGQEEMHEHRVGPVNMLPHSLWKSVDVCVGGTNVASFSQSSYSYKAYLQTLLGYGSDAKHSTLSVGSHFEMDTADQFDNTELLISTVPFINMRAAPNQQDQVDAVIGNEADVNLGWNKRREYHGNSNSVDFMMPLVHDFFQVKELLIPGVSFEVTFNRNPDEFFLQYEGQANAFKLRIDELELRLRRVVLMDDIAARNRILFDKHNIPYHHTASLSKTFNLEIGVQSHYKSFVFSEKVPNQIVVAILSQNAYQGHRNLNPFNFQNADVTKINLRFGGRSIPAYPFTPVYDQNRFVREYINLMDNVGINQKDRGCEITNALFKNGCCLYAWDTSPDLCFSRGHRHVRWHGGMDLEIDFDALLPQPMVAFVMAWYDSVFYITPQHQLHFEREEEGIDTAH